MQGERIRWFLNPAGSLDVSCLQLYDSLPGHGQHVAHSKLSANVDQSLVLYSEECAGLLLVYIFRLIKARSVRIHRIPLHGPRPNTGIPSPAGVNPIITTVPEKDS